MSLESPQLEDGYTPVANTIMDPICRTRLSGTDWDFLHFLWRKTYGWSKPSDIISLSQFCEATGMSQAHVCRTIKRLLAMNVIFHHVARIGNRETATYEFNKKVWSWKSLPKLATVARIGNSALPELAHTITIEDTTTKESLEDMSCKAQKATKKSDGFLVDAYVVLSYLNDKAHHKYGLVPSSVIEILKRLKAGATVSDLELIIDYKVYEWASTPLAKNLNNETLFRDCHYANYLEAARAWDIKRQTGANSLMMEPVETTPMTDEERKKAKADLFEGFGDGPDGDDPIQLEVGK